MTVEFTPKFGLTIWTENTDEFNRSQMTSSHNLIDLYSTKITKGSGDPPLVNDSLFDSLYFKTSTRQLFYCDSVLSTWREITLDAAILQSLLTTKGDLIGRSDSTAVRVPLGGNGQFLSVNTGTESGLQWADAVTPSGTQTLSNKTLSSPVLNTPTISRGVVISPTETWSVSTSPISTASNTVVPLNILTAQASSFLYTGEATNTWVPNVRGDGSTQLGSILAVGQSITVSVAAKINVAAAFSSTIQIDGSTNTILWQGGISPTSGNAGSTDVYTYTIVRTGSSTYSVFASRTRFASS